MEYKPEYLPDLLPVYYKRIFPYEQLYQWITADKKSMATRELSFTLFGDVYLRFQSFEFLQDFVSGIQKALPIKIDIGSIYTKDVNLYRYSANLQPIEKEVVFDIDLNDYDPVRTCCQGPAVCHKCWKFMVIACQILDAGLREEFNLHQLLWVFSGRRGIHCWVCDPKAKKFENIARSSVAEHFVVWSKDKPIQIYGDKIHPAIMRALKIIDKYFVKLIIEDQDALGSTHGLTQFLKLIDSSVRHRFDAALQKYETSLERWQCFLETFDNLFQTQLLPRNCRFLKEEIKLHYAYPRLDVNVSKDIKHLLKSPFCVHPSTGKISIPFSPKIVNRFDPMKVPTISLIIDEINAYDAKTKEQEENLEDTFMNDEINLARIKDYKKTSLLKPIRVFEEFLRGLHLASANGVEKPMEL